jgi:creatinase
MRSYPQKPLFSAAELERRQDSIRGWMAKSSVDACLLTSRPSIGYLSECFCHGTGNDHGLVITQKSTTSVTPAIDGSLPKRRTFGDNVIYAGFNKDGFFTAVKDLISSPKRIGIEFSHVTMDFRNELMRAFPGVEWVDVAGHVARLQMMKSDEEIRHISKLARVADLGGAACMEAVTSGAAEFEVARHAMECIEREIASVWPHAELTGSRVWFQSGLNTEGAYNPPTSRKIKQGDILALHCCPAVAGYSVNLQRTLFAESAGKEHLKIWELVCQALAMGTKLLLPDAKCSDIAKSLNDIYAQHDLLKYSSSAYGPQLREDSETVLEPGMVISLSPIINVPEGQKGAGGYCESHTLLITEKGNRNMGEFPHGPAHLIVKAGKKKR